MLSMTIPDDEAGQAKLNQVCIILSMQNRLAQLETVLNKQADAIMRLADEVATLKRLLAETGAERAVA